MTPPPPPTIQVKLDSDVAALKAAESRQFTASVIGSTNPAVSWTVIEGTQGESIQVSGQTATYLAPATEGIYHIRAMSLADGSKYAESSHNEDLAIGQDPLMFCTLAP